MMSTLFHSTTPFMLILTTILWILAIVEAQEIVTAGQSLSADDKNITWQSRDRHFAFGFSPIPGAKDRFLLAIWYAKIPQKTIVWYAKRDNPAADRGSMVELTESGFLVLKDPKGNELWRSQSLTGGSKVSHAAMLDTGNFVIASNDSTNIWESFKYPTNTILPSQELDVDGNLLSTLAETNYSKGKYQLRFDAGSLVLNQIDMFTGKPYEAYFDFGSGSRLVFNETGVIQILNPERNLVDLALNPIPKPDLNYYRATLDFYGVFTLYSYPKNPSGGDSWHVSGFQTTDICHRFAELAAGHEGKNRFGIGACGYNSICELDKGSGRPNCTCPPGFSFLDDNYPYAGCKQDYTNDPGDCSPDGSTIEEDRFEFKSFSFLNFPFSDYGIFHPASESDCRQSCLRDCSCAVVIYPTVSVDTCYKKQLPLFNGYRNTSALDSTVLFKVLKSDASRKKASTPNQSDENRKQVVLILSVLLGTSGVLNVFSLAAISLILFCVLRRSLRDLNSVPSRRDLETNLRFFTYKDLEHATNGFREELGRGAFGTVYKGALPSSYGDHVAVKKLDKFLKDGEREFKTEVKVIGQTHHKNLVRLIGYCDEDEHRLLVYEFMENSSLSNFLFGVLRPSWQQRLQIATGIAKGLTYLHEECSKQIVHCDIKPQNILLDESFTAKISDFGLAKLLINNKTRTQTGIRGTKGYVAPEWFRNAPVSVKVDVYSFGVMLLEMICCRKCVEVEMEEAAVLTEWAFQCYSEGMIEKLVENDEEARNDIGKLKMLLKVAIWCVQEEPMLRPSMRMVTMMLEGAVHVPNPPCPYPLDSMSMSMSVPVKMI